MGEPFIWGSLVVVLTVALIAMMKVTFWPKPDFRPSRVRDEHGSLPERLQDFTLHRAKKLQAMPLEEVMRMAPDEIEYAITRSGRRITLRTRRTVLPDGRIRVWIETADERWYSSAMPVSEVIFLQPAPKTTESDSTGQMAARN